LTGNKHELNNEGNPLQFRKNSSLGKKTLFFDDHNKNGTTPMVVAVYFLLLLLLLLPVFVFVGFNRFFLIRLPSLAIKASKLISLNSLLSTYEERNPK
jgi:hypothetical protein